MLRPRLLLVLLLALAAIGLVVWLTNDTVAPQGATPLRGDGDGDPSAGDAPDPLRVDGGDTGSDGVAGGAERGASAAERAAQASRVTGRVVDERGHGLGSATVEAHVVDPRGLRGAPYPDREKLSSTTTERDGSFTLPTPTRAWLRLVAHAPGRARVGRLIASAGADVLLVLPPAGTLHVEVVDGDGRAVAEATVHAESGTTRQHAEAPKGRATFDALPPGSVRLRVHAPGRGTVLAGPLAVKPLAESRLTVVMAEAVALRGVVLDEATGKPVAGAQVYAAQPGRAVQAAPTDPQGRFGPVPAGGVGQRVFVSVQAEGYAPALEPVILRAAPEQSVEVRLATAEAWTGRVVDARGTPVIEALVMYTHDGIDRAALHLFGVTDAEGRFTMPPPPPPAPGRRVVLTARAEQGLGALALRPGMLRPDPLVLTLVAGTEVSGRVITASGAALAGVTVRLAPSWGDVPRGMHPDAAASRLLAANEEGFEGLATASASDGRWAIRGVPAGPYRLRFVHRGVEQRRAELLHVGADPVAAGTETLHGGRTLGGEVLDAHGGGLAGVGITVAPQGEPRAARRTTTDADGHFAVDGLAPGSWSVGATYPGRPRLRADAEVRAGEDAHIVLRIADPALLSGRVSAAGEAYGGLLTLAFAESEGRRAAARRRTVRVAAGRLRLEDAPPGRWTVEAFGAGGLRAQVFDVEIDAGREASVTFDLQRGARLRGHVATASGDPVPTARIVLTHEASGARHLATGGAGGGYALDGLVAGTYSLSVSGRGGAPTRDTLTLAAGATLEHDVRLPAGGTAEILVLDERGRPVAEARLAFRTDTASVRTAKPVRTDRRGIAVQRDLPLGALTVRAVDAQGRVGIAGTLLEAGRPARVEIQVRPRER